MVNYTKNRWNNYDDSKTFSENLENDAILTLEKANHMEQGIYDANRRIEIGTIKVAENTENPSITVTYNQDSIIMDFILPRTNLSSADMKTILNNSKEEFVKLFSKIYVGEDNEASPNDNDVMFLLSKDGNSIEKIRTFKHNNDGSVTKTDLRLQVDISNIITDASHQFITQSQLDKLNSIDDNANHYIHPTGDGNMHIPATGTTSKGKFLSAGSMPGEVDWRHLEKEDITNALGYTPANKSDVTTSVVDSTKSGLMSPEMFKKLNGIEEGANNYTHPNTHSADMILETNEKQFISKADKGLLRYTNDQPTLTAHGGIPAGTTFDNKALAEILGDILYPYVPPVVSCTVTAPANGGTYEFGTNPTITSVRVGVTKKSKDITKIEIFNTEDISGPLATQADGIKDGGTFNYTISKVLDKLTSNLRIRARITDTSGKTVTADSGAFYVIYPMWYGAIDKDATVDEAAVKNTTKLVQTKANRSLTFNSDNQRLMIAYPASYGQISSIMDPNGFNITDTFTRYMVSMRFGDDDIQYFVYVNEASTVNNFTVSVKY